MDIYELIEKHRWLPPTVLAPLALVLLKLAEKLMDHLLARRQHQQAKEPTATELLENYRKEVERLTTEQNRLVDLVHEKEAEIDGLWASKRLLREEMQILALKNAEFEQMLRLLTLKNAELEQALRVLRGPVS